MTNRGELVSIADDIVSFVATEKHATMIHEWFEENFVCSLLERNEMKLRYEISESETGDYSLKDVFRLLEEKKEELGFGEYAVSQTSLEQIFCNFALYAERNKKAQE